jgi:hypothetical protein
MQKSNSDIKKIHRNKITKTKIKVDSDSEKDSEHENSDEDEDVILHNKISNNKLLNYKSDVISKYIVMDKIMDFNNKSIFCYYLWSGIEDLDRWELNRKVNTMQVKKIYKEMKADYEKNNHFIFYEPVHLAVKTDNIFYVIDGQHRLLACNKLFKKNKYPIQQIPCVLWFPKSEDEFIEIFDKINSRTPLDKTKLFNYKINEIIEWIDKTYGDRESLWGKQRPKINKDLFVEKMRESDTIHKLETKEIIPKIDSLNIKLRGLPRNKRCDKHINDSIHNHAESINFFLGYDKELKWIEEL